MTATATAPERTQRTQEIITTGTTGGWLRSLIRTDHDGTALLLRLTLALVIFPHGAQHMLGWFGGPGFTGAMSYLTGTVGLPSFIAFLVIFIEVFGSIGLAVGFLGRVAAAGIASVMIGAVLTTHLPFGFFMDWFGTKAGEGFEYHILALGIAAAIMINGSGAFSVDRALASRRITTAR